MPNQAPAQPRLTHGQRWQGWARALTDGRHRATFGHRPLPLTLRHLALPPETHWHFTKLSLNVSTTIRLAIRPLLEALAARDTAKPAGAASGVTFAAPAKDVMARDAELRFARLASNEARDGADQAAMIAASRSVDAPVSPSVSSSNVARQDRPAPLALVFRRLARIEDQPAAQVTLVRRRAEELALTLVERSRRIERPPAGESRMAMKAPQPAAPASFNTPASFNAPNSFNTPGGFISPFGQQPMQAQALSDVVVEQLTERVIREIDHRVVAQRERMGRIS